VILACAEGWSWGFDVSFHEWVQGAELFIHRPSVWTEFNWSVEIQTKR
jgi:hypothetical protein